MRLLRKWPLGTTLPLPLLNPSLDLNGASTGLLCDLGLFCGLTPTGGVGRLGEALAAAGCLVACLVGYPSCRAEAPLPPDRVPGLSGQRGYQAVAPELTRLLAQVEQE